MKNISPYNLKVLLSEIAQGNHRSFRVFFDLYKNPLLNFALGFTHSIADAEEIVQDVFLKIWESRATLSNIENPDGYVFRMTRNRTMDVLEKIARNEKLVQKAWENIRQFNNPADQALETRESLKLINNAVEKLPARKQEIFKLSKYDGLNHDEISNTLGISKQTVKNNLSETLKQVGNYLKAHATLLSLFFSSLNF